MVKQKQVTFEEVVIGIDLAPQPDVMDLFSSNWVPNSMQLADLHKDM